MGRGFKIHNVLQLLGTSDMIDNFFIKTLVSMTNVKDVVYFLGKACIDSITKGQYLVQGIGWEYHLALIIKIRNHWVDFDNSSRPVFPC